MKTRKIRGGLFGTETKKQIQCLKTFFNEFYRKYQINIKDFEKKKYYEDIPDNIYFNKIKESYIDKKILTNFKTSKNFFAKISNKLSKFKVKSTEIEVERNIYLNILLDLISIFKKIQDLNDDYINDFQYDVEDYITKLSNLDKLINQIIETNNEGYYYKFINSGYRSNYDMFYNIFCKNNEINKNIEMIFKLYFEYSYVIKNKERKLQRDSLLQKQRNSISNKYRDSILSSKEGKSLSSKTLSSKSLSSKSLSKTVKGGKTKRHKRYSKK